MATLLYIHGFLSSPLSYKAQLTKTWISQTRPDIHFCCPKLTPYPDECYRSLMDAIGQSETPVYLLGSSMGGFWAHVLAAQLNLKAVLINPAVEALTLMPAYVGRALKNYHGEQYYCLSTQDIDVLASYAAQLNAPFEPKNFWLLAQTGDSTLDYRAAVSLYGHCKQTIEAGGSHGFDNFERHLPAIIDFFETN